MWLSLIIGKVCKFKTFKITANLKGVLGTHLFLRDGTEIDEDEFLDDFHNEVLILDFTHKNDDAGSGMLVSKQHYS